MIRKMVETDLVQVVDLENICFPKGGWTLEQFRYELMEIRSQACWYLKRIKRIIGYY